MFWNSFGVVLGMFWNLFRDVFRDHARKDLSKLSDWVCVRLSFVGHSVYSIQITHLIRHDHVWLAMAPWLVDATPHKIAAGGCVDAVV